MKIGRDKYAHAAGSAIIVGLVSLFTGSIIAGMLVAIGAGIAKEVVWDRLLKRGTFSWADLGADAVGVGAGALLMVAIL